MKCKIEPLQTVQCWECLGVGNLDSYCGNGDNLASSGMVSIQDDRNKLLHWAGVQRLAESNPQADLESSLVLDSSLVWGIHDKTRKTGNENWLLLSHRQIKLATLSRAGSFNACKHHQTSMAELSAWGMDSTCQPCPSGHVFKQQTCDLKPGMLGRDSRRRPTTQAIR